LNSRVESHPPALRSGRIRSAGARTTPAFWGLRSNDRPVTCSSTFGHNPAIPFILSDRLTAFGPSRVAGSSWREADAIRRVYGPTA
jgi:hypothetical protein